LAEQLVSLADQNVTYAVRSSGEFEDRADFSYAGQFTSFLHLENVDEMIRGTREVWRSAEDSLL
jgi:phosphoenolpyruvate synthase/pyruvate phosphate dikinase